jgi:hypothetical protein
LPVAWPAAARGDDKTACTNAYVAAQTRRADHKLLAARDELRTCARQECSALMHGQMARDCTAWLGEVEASIPSVVLSAKDASGADVTEVSERIDGLPVGNGLGRAVDIDPGPHVFDFEAPHASRVSQTVVVLEGKKDQVIQVTLDLGRPSAAPPPLARPPSRMVVSAGAAAGEATRSPSAWTWVAFGVGAAGIAAGSVLGVLALGAKSTLDGECNSQHGCAKPSAQGDIDSLHSLSWASNIGFGVGALGAASGLLLLLTTGGPRNAEEHAANVAPWVGLGSAGLSGTFR